MEQHNSRIITEANRSKQMWNWWRAKLDLATQSPWYASYILRRFYDFMKILRPSKQLVASTVTGAALLASSIAMNPAPAHAASITVNSTADTVANDGQCTLREAMVAADTNAAYNGCSSGAVGSDTITINVNGTITLGSDLPTIGNAGEDIVVNGPGATNLTINGNLSRLFYSTGAGNDLTISGLTLQGSNTIAVQVANDITIINSVINAAGSSGVSSVGGSVSVTNSTISASGTHGVYAQINATVTNSTISGSATGSGVIANTGNATVTNSTISGNASDGVRASTGLTVINSTISGNGLRGVESNNNATVINSTVTGNASFGIQKNAVGALTLKNSLVVGNNGGTGDVSCIGANPMVTNGKNLLSNSTGTASTGCAALSSEVTAIPVASIIGSLANNGGSTKTHALVAGSPAIDKGNNADSPGATDQRGTGFARIANATIDIGAFEFQVSNAVGGVAELITPHTASPVTTTGIMATLSALFMGAGAWLMRRR